MNFVLSNKCCMMSAKDTGVDKTPDKTLRIPCLFYITDLSILIFTNTFRNSQVFDNGQTCIFYRIGN